MYRQDDTWQSHFGDLAALPLGVSGSTVEMLAWRLAVGGERPEPPPRVAALLIGINNLYKDVSDPAVPLEWLVRWLRAAWPYTQVGGGEGEGGGRGGGRGRGRLQVAASAALAARLVNSAGTAQSRLGAAID